MSEFKYADHNDELTGLLISQNYDEAYWGRSEARLLAAARAYISGKFGHEGQKQLRMLDLGCGMGRLIPEFAAEYREVVGLEPDGERCRMAQDFLAGRKVSNAWAWQGSLGDYLDQADPAPGFDVVLCSHIFQHISHETFFGILEDLKRATAKNAVFIFTTTFTEGENNEYTTESFQASDRVSDVTDREGFEAAVREGKRLPVCRFARPWLDARFREHGLRVRKFSCYHFFGAHNEENDVLWTQDPEKRPLARDAWYLCEWAEEEVTEGETSDTPEKKTPTPDNESPASGKVAFLQFYSLKEDTKLPELSRPGLRKEDGGEGSVLEDIKTAEGFLYGAGLHFKAERYLAEYPLLGLKDIPIRSSHILLTVYPDSAACQVSVCLTVGETPVRNLVYLHQIQCADSVKFSLDGTGGISIPELCKAVLASAGLSPVSEASTAIITELNTLGESTDAEELTDGEARCIYGVLSGDEGWQHVPAALARSRLENSWSSRDFAKIVAFAGNYVMLNFNRGDTHAAYLEKQHRFAGPYWGGLNPYFTMDAATAGVNHGLLFSVETGMLVKTSMDRILNSRPDARRGSGGFLQNEIKRSKKYRADMIQTMNQLEKVNITELGELDALVMETLNNEKRMESLRNLLELVESDLDLMYQTKTNHLVNFLTVLGLLLALAQLILPFFS